MGLKDLKERLWRLFNPLWPYLVILVITLIFFYPVWLKGYVPLPADFVVGVYYPWLDYKWGYTVGVPVKNPMTTDVVSFTFPMQMLAIDLIKSGQWPLWNPYILSGTPLLANFQSAPFAPTNFVYFLFDRLDAWSIQIVLQHLLAAIFSYLLLRHWGLEKFASLIGGVAFAFSGFNLIWSQWNGHALAAAFIPLILMFEDKYLVRGRLIYGIFMAIILAFQMFSGYPQVVIYTAVAMVLLSLFRFRKDRQWVVRTIMVGVFSMFGFGIAAPQILPGAELLAMSQRAVEYHPYEWAFLPWVKLITFLAPDYFGNHATQNYWGPQDYTSNTGFVGVVAFILALFAFQLVKLNKPVQFLFGLTIVSLVLAFPTPVSVFLWKSGVLGLQAASAHRSLIMFNVAISLLAGFGVHFILNRNRFSVIKPFFLPGMILFGFGGYALLMIGLNKYDSQTFIGIIRGISIFEVALRNIVIPVGAFIISFCALWFVRNKLPKVKYMAIMALLVVMCIEMFRFGWKFTPFSPRNIVYPSTPILEFLMLQDKPFRVTGNKVIPMNMRMPYNLESPEGYDAVYSVIIAKFLASLNDNSSTTKFTGRYGFVDREGSHLLDLINTKYFLAVKKDRDGQPSYDGQIPAYLDDKKFKVVFEDRSTAVLENQNVLPRAFFVRDWQVIEDEVDLLDQLLNPAFPQAEKVLLQENPSITKDDGALGKSRVFYEEYESQKSKVNVEAAQNGFLFVSDAWFPGWKAFIDGKETKIYRANFAFRAIELTKGNHTVNFVYQPESFYNGLRISVLSFITMLFLALLVKLNFNEIKR